MRTLEVGFTDRIPSKKNGKRILGRGRKKFVGSSQDYMDWEKKHVAKLLPFRFIFSGLRVSVHIAFTYGDEAKNWDLTNKAEGIMDALVKAKVIDDDSVAVVPRLSLQYVGVKRGAWRADVTITEWK